MRWKYAMMLLCSKKLFEIDFDDGWPIVSILCQDFEELVMKSTGRHYSII
jgi:hypothetical protein